MSRLSINNRWNKYKEYNHSMKNRKEDLSESQWLTQKDRGRKLPMSKFYEFCQLMKGYEVKSLKYNIILDNWELYSHGFRDLISIERDKRFDVKRKSYDVL